MAALGYALIAVGLLLLSFTFWLGYGLYVSFGESGALSSLSTAPSSGNITSAISGFTSSAEQTIKGSVYMALEVIVLFLFASVGYKIAYIGVSLLRGGRQDEGKQEKQK